MRLKFLVIIWPYDYIKLRTFSVYLMSVTIFQYCELIVQGFKVIRQWHITGCISLIMITQNYPFCRLQLMVKSFGHLQNQPIKIQWMSPKLLNQEIRKRNCKTLGTSVINMPLSPFFLWLFNFYIIIISCQRKKG